MANLTLTTASALATAIDARADDSDAALVARAGADERAFAALYERHARTIARVAYRLLGSEGDVDDIVQETFLDARDDLHRLEDAQALRSWLITIAVRRVHRLLRKRRRRAFLFACFVELSAKTSDPRDREPVDELYEALADLPVELRVPWTLARVEELTLPKSQRPARSRSLPSSAASHSPTSACSGGSHDRPPSRRSPSPRARLGRLPP